MSAKRVEEGEEFRKRDRKGARAVSQATQQSGLPKHLFQPGWIEKACAPTKLFQPCWDRDATELRANMSWAGPANPLQEKKGYT